MFEKTDTHLLIGFLNHEFVRRAIYKQIGELVMLVHYQCLSLCNNTAHKCLFCSQVCSFSIDLELNIAVVFSIGVEVAVVFSVIAV